MTIEVLKSSIKLIDIIEVEEADTLLDWLQNNPKGKVNLEACTHLHAANLQVLMASKAKISEWPEDAALSEWLKKILKHKK